MFSIDDFNNRIGANNNQPSVANGWSVRPNAVLYIFSPRQTPNVTVRNFEYNFTTAFTDELADVVDKAARSGNGIVGHNYTDDFRMSNSVEANRSIAPCASGEMVYGNVYDSLYTWLLILDNASFEGRHNPSGLSNRLLYTGFFLEEPCTPSQFGGYVLNEKAMMLPTHLTYLDIKSVYSGFGSIVQSRPRADIDIVNPMATLQTSPTRDYLIRPSDIINENFIDGEGDIYYTPERNYVGNMNDSIKLSTTLNNPKEHIKSIVSGLAKTSASRMMVDNLPMSVGVNPVAIDDDFSWVNSLRQNMAGEVLPDRFVGLNVNQNIMFCDLIAKYPVLRETTQFVKVPWSLPEAPADDSAPTPINVWSSLLMSSVPSVFSSFGISDASFRYCSVNLNSSAFNTFNNSPMIEIYSLGVFVPQESQDTMKQRFFGALAYLEKNIFPIITTQSGNFDAIIRYDSAKECAVLLNLLDVYDTPNNDITVRNNLFGGLHSPLVGSGELKLHNANEFGNLVQYVNAATNYSITY